MIADSMLSLREVTSRTFMCMVSSPLFVLLMLVSIVVTGCGESGVGSGGTGVPEGSQIGTVTGFGSVIVDSNRYETNEATISVELDPSDPQPSVIDDVQLGMQVQVEYQNSDQAVSVRVLPALIGLVQRVDTNQLVIAGQIVTTIDTNEWTTVFEGFETVSELSGALVRVFGQANGSGSIAATRIERLPTQTAATRMVTGVVTEVITANEFKLGGLTVLRNAQTIVSPSGAPVQEGTLVSVLHQSGPVGTELVANRVVVRAALVPQTEQIRLFGPVRLSDLAGQFRVGWVRVDARQAVVTGGSLQDLTNTSIVRVTGTRNGQVLVATTVEFVSGQVLAERLILGPITDFFSPRSFRVRGAPIDATNALLIGGESQNLGDGVVALLRGQISRGLFVAREIEFVNPGGANLPDLTENVRVLDGRAYLVQPLIQMMVVNRVRVSWDAQTRIVGDLTSVGDGQRVVVTGMPQGDGLVATRIDVLPN